MRTSVIFVICLTFTSMIISQAPPSRPNAFTQVRNLLSNFRQSIVDDQNTANIAEKKAQEWCRVEIQKAEALVAKREHDVDSIKEHIEYLENEIAEHEKDKKTREERIVANEKLLEDFKKQRCDNNLIFVKQLREHMEGVDVLKLLKADIKEYFANKTNSNAPAFIERFSEFSHLLNDEHKQIFVQLSQAVDGLPDVEKLTNDLNEAASHDRRTEIGDEHVDNNKGELQKLEHVAHQEVAEFNSQTEKRVIEMIDALIAHLEDSREELTNNEIKAAEDFAIFQSNTAKENEHLKATIAELVKEIEEFKNQLNTAQEQLAKREKLLQDARNALANLQTMCQEKQQYYDTERARRTSELGTVDSATNIFNNIVENLSQRVRSRTNNLANGKEAGDHIIKEVVEDHPEISGNLENRVGERNEVVF